MSIPAAHDLAAVVHLHSTHSDGTGTVAEIAEAGRQTFADVVILTDHDSLAARDRGEEGWYGGTLLLCACEVSPHHHDHYLAFGLDETIDHAGLSAGQIAERVRAQGAFGIAAHPFADTSPFDWVPPMPFDLDGAEVEGVELWSMLADVGERVSSLREVAAFVRDPLSQMVEPPAGNLRRWEQMCRRRATVAIGGLDAHQIGLRIAGRVPLRLMSYRRAFSLLRTHVLLDAPPRGEVEADRAAVFGAIAAGRCYLGLDGVAPTTGFRFWAQSGERALEMGGTDDAGEQEWTLRVRSPRPCSLQIVRDGVVEARADEATALELTVRGPGVWRAEGRLRWKGAERSWVLTNPVYLR